VADDEEIPTFSIEVGSRLRAVRRSRQLSLDDVERESGGRWSASAVGAYERGFRNLSLPRLQELAAFYDVPMGALLGEPDMAAMIGARPPKVVLDLAALATHDDAEPVLRYLRSIIVERGDYNGRVLSIRRDDLRAVCAVLQTDERDTFSRLAAWGALVSGGPEDEDEELVSEV
jgi:transcriptional regulator with XRE-family HTH domain